MGGEKPDADFRLGRRQGSPPHGRGKGVGIELRVGQDGITPAWAGKSAAATPEMPPPWDHPRMGGEKVPIWGPSSLWRGSPPHGRGKARPHLINLNLSGITPAWAGKSSILGCSRPEQKDHPRMGGEKTKKIP